MPCEFMSFNHKNYSHLPNKNWKVKRSIKYYLPDIMHFSIYLLQLQTLPKVQDPSVDAMR